MPAHDIWALGAGVYVLGAGLIVLGENVVKRSQRYDDEDTESNFSRQGWCCWFSGVFSFVLGNLAHFVAFMFAAQSTLESLGSTVLLWNLIIASSVNRETIIRGHIIATGVILGA